MTENGGTQRFPLFRPSAEEAAEWEIRHHIEERVDRLVAAGLSPEAAAREAERSFGDARAIHEELRALGRARHRRSTMGAFFDGFRQDLRFALRALRREPGVAGAVIVTLGLGFAAATALLAIVDPLLLRPLPYRDVDRLVEVNHRFNESTTLPFLYTEQMEALREAATPLESWAVHESDAVVRLDGPEPTVVGVEVVSHELDDVLGVKAFLGRTFTADDARPGAPPVALLSHDYWRRLGGSRELLGREIRLEDGPFTVVGVLPPDFKFPVAGRRRELWLPLRTDMTWGRERALTRAGVVGHLRPDIMLDVAQERMDAAAAALEEEQPGPRAWATKLTPVGRWRSNPAVVRALRFLGGAVALLLVVALVNAINLLLARSTRRAREMAVRVALGCSGARLFRQLATEAVMVSLLAGTLATALAWGAVVAVRGQLPPNVTLGAVYDFNVDPRILAFAFAMAMGAGLLVGLLPSLRAVAAARRETAAGGVHGTLKGRRTRIGRGLVTLEVAVSVALLAGAALLLHSFARLVQVDPGYRPEGLALVAVDLSTNYPDSVSQANFMRRLKGRVQALPEVRAVSVADGLPPGSGFAIEPALQAEGQEPVPEELRPFLLPYAIVEPGYFATLGASLVDGRDFGPGDRAEAIIDRDMARLLWPDARAVGKRFRTGSNSPWRTVVGVVDDLKLMGQDDREYPMSYFLPLTPGRYRSYMGMAVRTTGSVDALIPALRRAVFALDPEQPVYEAISAADAMSRNVAEPRFLTALMAGLAGLAAVLAAVGLYALLAYTVSQRRRELGVRAAIGASATALRRLILGDGLRLAILGTVIGLAAALAGGRFIRSLLFEVEPTDPWTLGAVAALMLTVAGTAALVPAVRATRVDPAEVMRSE